MFVNGFRREIVSVVTENLVKSSSALPSLDGLIVVWWDAPPSVQKWHILRNLEDSCWQKRVESAKFTVESYFSINGQQVVMQSLLKICQVPVKERS